MSRQDRLRWDKKWSEMIGEIQRPHPLLCDGQHLFTGGLALDLACGQGRNALYLARHNYMVHGVDISQIALRRARNQAEEMGVGHRVIFTQADLDDWQPLASAYDLICVIRFLDRSLFPALQASLCPEGLLFYSTRHIGILKKNQGANCSYLLEYGELKEAFSRLQILHYDERSEDVDLIARKP